MKYSIVKIDEKNITLMLHQEDGVKQYTFASDIPKLSNMPGLTRLIGRYSGIPSETWLMFSEQGNHERILDSGEFIISEHTEKYTMLSFSGKKLNGNWVLRKLMDGQVLLWKPLQFNAIIECASKKSIGVIPEELTSDSKMVDFNFSHVVLEDNQLSGVGLAAGVWTSGEGVTTLFTEDIVKDIFKQMQDNLINMIVDFNHDFVNTGRLTEVKLLKDPILRIFVKGVSNKFIPRNAGISIAIKGKTEWNPDLNVNVLVKGVPIGVSVLTLSAPACKVCWIDK